MKNGKYDREPTQFVKLWKDMSTKTGKGQQSENISTESQNKINRKFFCSAGGENMKYTSKY